MLDIFWVLFYLTVGIYTLFLLWLFRKSKPQANQTISKLSVVIPIKNEAGNLKRLLSSFGDHALLSEIILVDDHSSDNWKDVITDFSNGGLNLRIVSLNKEQKGKKAAIHAGIESAMEDWVLCSPTPGEVNSPVPMADSGGIVINEWLANPVAAW